MSLSVGTSAPQLVHSAESRKFVPQPAPQPHPAQPEISADRVSLSPASLASTSPASGG